MRRRALALALGLGLALALALALALGLALTLAGEAGLPPPVPSLRLRRASLQSSPRVRSPGSPRVARPPPKPPAPLPSAA